MAGPSDIQTRVLAIMAGTYPVGTPYLVAGTFTLGSVHLPHQNPQWPTGLVLNRHFDLLWGGGGYDAAGGAENATDGPHVLQHRATLRVQYVVTRPGALVPRDKELVLGAETAARLRAQQDARPLLWALNHRGAWEGACAGLLSISHRIEKADVMRVQLLVDMVWLDEMPIASRPSTWSA